MEAEELGKVIHERMFHSEMYWKVKRSVKEEIIKPKYKVTRA